MTERKDRRKEVETLKRIYEGERITESELHSLGDLTEIGKQFLAERKKGDNRDSLIVILGTAGFTYTELDTIFGKVQPATNEAPGLTTINGSALYERFFQPRQFLLDAVLSRGTLAMLGGRPKSGKSWLAFQLAQAIDTGLPFLGKPTTKTKVLYLCLEDGERRIHERLHIRKWKPQNTHFVFSSLPLDNEKGGGIGAGFEQLANEVKSLDAGLIIIDTLRSAISGHVDESDNAGMAAILNPLANFAHENNRAILVTHHTTKATSSEDVFNSFRGASSIRGAYDLGVILERKNKEAEATLKFESRDSEIEDMTISFNPAQGWQYEGDITRIEQIHGGRKIVKALTEMGEGSYTREDIAKHMGITPQAVGQQLHLALKDKHVQRKDGAKASNGKAIEVWSLSR